MNVLTIRVAVAIAVAAVAGVTVAGVASGSAQHSSPTKTKTVYVRSTTNAPPVAAVISLRLAAFGGASHRRVGRIARTRADHVLVLARRGSQSRGLRRSPVLGRLGSAGRLRERHRPHPRLAAERVHHFDRGRGRR